MTRFSPGMSHGLALDLVEPAHPALTDAELAPVLAAYPGIGTAPELAWHSQRPFAASAILRTQNGGIFVKRHDPRLRSVSDLHEEHDFIAHLRAGGAAVPAVLETATGQTALAGEAGTYELHEIGEGDDRYRDAHSWTPARSRSDAEAIGHALGQLHLAAQGFTTPPRRTRMLVAGDALIRADDPEAALAAWAATDPPLAAALADRPWQNDLRRCLLGWHQAMKAHRPAMQPLWAHGDFHASNLLWRDGGVSAVLDFGLANQTSALFDLATAIERNAIAWLQSGPDRTDIGRPDLAASLLHGYDAARPRPAPERRALHHLMPLVHVDFALSELAYFHAVTGSASDQAAAYTDFLLGHAAWFATAHGGRFLDSLAA